MLITTKNWSIFAESIAAPADPSDYNQASVDRLMDILEPYVVRVTGVKPQFRGINKTLLIDFETKEDREFYQKAWERYLQEKAKAEGADGLSRAQSRFNVLVQFLKFRQAAEICRARYLARAMWEGVNKYNKASVAALNFRPTITKIVQILMDDYGVKRDEISLIWGGSQVIQTKKGGLKKRIIENEALLAMMEAEGISLDDVNLGEDVDVKEEVHFDPSLRMGHQNRQARQYEIDQFQRGISKYCLFTFKAGGVGLSLHHTDRYTTRYNESLDGFQQFYREIQEWNTKHPSQAVLIGKARRKESGYVFEQDIPFITTRPRELYCAPTYSAIELVQGLGRCPRLTSLSDTLQMLVFFRGTIEERVKAITDMKLRCLSKVIRQREHWEDIVDCGEAQYREIEDRSIKMLEDVKEEDYGIMSEEIGEDDATST